MIRRPETRVPRRDKTRQINRFLADRRSGAAELALEALDLLEWVETAGWSPARVTRLGQRMIRAHPAMGSVWNAIRTEDRREFRQCLRKSQPAITRQFRRAVPRGAAVLTLSYSSTVLAALRRRDFQVYVAESRPGAEGQRTARALRPVCATVQVVPDARIADIASGVSVAVVGADALNQRTVINKTGTHVLALAARAAGIPCYVLADSSKMVPESWTPPAYSSRCPFEATPRRLFTEIITERR